MSAGFTKLRGWEWKGPSVRSVPGDARTAAGGAESEDRSEPRAVEREGASPVSSRLNLQLFSHSLRIFVRQYQESAAAIAGATLTVLTGRSIVSVP
jgi:hypothetical protein